MAYITRALWAIVTPDPSLNADARRRGFAPAAVAN
jgi:hypothetical protein